MAKVRFSTADFWGITHGNGVNARFFSTSPNEFFLWSTEEAAEEYLMFMLLDEQFCKEHGPIENPRVERFYEHCVADALYGSTEAPTFVVDPKMAVESNANRIDGSFVRILRRLGKNRGYMIASVDDSGAIIPLPIVHEGTVLIPVCTDKEVADEMIEKVGFFNENSAFACLADDAILLSSMEWVRQHSNTCEDNLGFILTDNSDEMGYPMTPPIRFLRHRTPEGK